MESADMLEVFKRLAEKQRKRQEKPSEPTQGGAPGVPKQPFPL